MTIYAAFQIIVYEVGMKGYCVHRLLIVLAFTLLFCRAAGLLYAEKILSENELEQFSEMLAQEGFTLQHAAFCRDWDPSTLAKSEWHLQVLEGGFSAVEILEDLQEKMRKRDESSLPRFLGDIAAENGFYSLSLSPPEIRNSRELFTYVELSFDAINSMYEKAFSHLSVSARDSLSAFMMQVMLEAEDAADYQEYFARRGLPWEEEPDIQAYAAMIDDLDLGALNAATEAMICLRDFLADFELFNQESLSYKSKYGTMILGSPGNDTYDQTSFPQISQDPICFILDPAGEDIYPTALHTSASHPLLMVIDKSGDDLYSCREPSFFAQQGVFISADYAGNDLYHLADFSFSAILGSMWHLDTEGDDIYKGGVFAQAAAIAGLACLQDVMGNDSYHAGSLAQAFASAKASALLADYSGADSYYLGGRYFHAPLMPNDYRTMGQGMGFGIRPYLAGGLGLLYDADGSDKYIGGVYAQGVGYWYATGILMDEAGNDVYNAVYYPQGSGIHLASGILYDREGNDCYYSRNGPGQGAGHDYGFGMLIDGSGDDAYSIHGGNGLGLSNSLGIFADLEGKDRYERSEAQNYGNAAFARNTGGLGLFLDAGGEDSYPDSLKSNNNDWQKGSYGFGRDVALNETADPEPDKDEEQLPAPAADAPIAEIFAAASEWEVGNAIHRVRTAREYMLQRADEARSYILEQKMDTESGLEFRALQALCKEDETFRDLLLEQSSAPDSLKAKNSIALLAGMRDERLLPIIENYLKQDMYLVACLSALANIDDPKSLVLLSNYRDLESERLRFLVARSISMHSSAQARDYIEEFREDPSFLIQALIRNLPKEKL